MNLKEILSYCVDWIHLIQNRPVAKFCEKGKEASGYIKRGKFLDEIKTNIFLGRTLLSGVSELISLVSQLLSWLISYLVYLVIS
jgi:hypothetical protein